VYCQKVWFFIGWTPSDVRSYFKDHWLWDIDCRLQDFGGMSFSVRIHGKRRLALWVRRTDDYSALAHEAVHTANYILDGAGHRITCDNDEAQAYLVGAIVKKALGEK
jgi:hypothetical protein